MHRLLGVSIVGLILVGLLQPPVRAAIFSSIPSIQCPERIRSNDQWTCLNVYPSLGSGQGSVLLTELDPSTQTTSFQTLVPTRHPYCRSTTLPSGKVQLFCRDFLDDIVDQSLCEPTFNGPCDPATANTPLPTARQNDFLQGHYTVLVCPPTFDLACFTRQSIDRSSQSPNAFIFTRGDSTQDGSNTTQPCLATETTCESITSFFRVSSSLPRHLGQFSSNDEEVNNDLVYRCQSTINRTLTTLGEQLECSSDTTASQAFSSCSTSDHSRLGERCQGSLVLPAQSTATDNSTVQLRPWTCSYQCRFPCHTNPGLVLATCNDRTTLTGCPPATRDVVCRINIEDDPATFCPEGGQPTRLANSITAQITRHDSPTILFSTGITAFCQYGQLTCQPSIQCLCTGESEQSTCHQHRLCNKHGTLRESLFADVPSLCMCDPGFFGSTCLHYKSNQQSCRHGQHSLTQRILFQDE